MKIVVLEPLGISEESTAELAETLRSRGHEVIVYETRTGEAEELIRRAKDADALLIANLPLRREVIAECPRLKFISVAFTGVDHVDLDICRERGIAVSNAAGYSTHAVAELVFGLAIAVLRNLVPCDRETRRAGTKDGLIGGELYGKTFGIVGTGAIGLAAAGIAAAFGCRVLAYSRSQRPEALADGISYVSLDELLQTSDIVSLHVPLTDETRTLIDENRLAMMKPTAVLINTARGPVVDNAALARALNEGRLAGAGIDVFETEPPLDPGHPLASARNTVLTPHVAFATREALQTRAQIAFANAEAWLNGERANRIL